MADERYQWLDQEAAERLLRGEPVDAVDDHARSQAEHLAGALDAARVPTVLPSARTELPGEAAALAAFREAIAERAAAPVTAGAAGRTEHADLGRVRLAPVPAPRRRWGRSLRYGLAAAVAAVTVGGVAVAAGTGVLPMVGPAPASSVTAGESADPLVSEDPGIRTDPEAPSAEPGGGGDPTPGASPTAGTGTTAPSTGAPDGHGTGTPGPGTPKPGRSTAGTGTDPGGPGTETGGTGGVTGGDLSGTKSRERLLKACREYRSGKLDATGRKGLTKLLRDGDTLRRYCDRILGGATGTPEDGGKDDPKDSDGDGKGDGGNGDGRDYWGNDGGVGDAGKDRRDTARFSTPDPARLTAVLPLGTGVTARLPLPV
ncbi:hypothetical protein OG462_27060 [Streptomyces sp. NBC_01077]|uniref:hypothetical protein n=1 Tax=Streptomyces sp. NBC_01077 TaxID=2903746 RepID=UPI00386C9247|nr:hypothetical protein OG462_27060 [Streptomyces sp. NBC_01077]